MDPFELLKKDHKAVANLFERIESVSGKAMLGLFKQIKSALDLHSHIEETILYPALEKASETRDLTLEAYEEHKVVKDLLGELDLAKVVSDEWKAKLTVLKENVEHHVDEEENQLFDKANDVLTGDEAEMLGDRMQAEKVKRGGGVEAPDTKAARPGLLRTIVNAFTNGLSSGDSSKTSGKKKSVKTKAAKKTGAAKSSIKTSAAAVKKGAPARKASSKAKAAAKAKPRSAAKSARKKSAAKKSSTPRKKTSTKRGQRGK